MNDTRNICQSEFSMLNGMREFYQLCGMIATSEVATVALIRSYIAYHRGQREALRATIKPSRGHSYRVNGDSIVRIVDYFDHRNGVVEG